MIQEKKVEVINSREKENVVEKLKLFTKVKTVTRDFSQTYKNAISEALPKSKQIVDRFHIFKKLRSNVCKRIHKYDFRKCNFSSPFHIFVIINR